jgi:glycosyltransferase involved in cell wall biosynthesis
LKIAFNARFLSKPYNGFGQHCIRLIQNLAKIDKENHYYLFIHDKDSYIPPDLPSNFEVKLLEEKYRFLGKGFSKFYWEQMVVPEAAEKFKVDLLHNPYDTAPFFAQPFATISTIHDIIPWKLPDYHRKLNTRLRLYVNRKSLRNVDKIIALTISAKLDVAALLDIDADNVLVIPNAKADHFVPEVNFEKMQIVRERFNIDSEYIFYIGGFDKRKNLKRLIEGFYLFKQRNRSLDYKLIIAGSPPATNNNKLYYDVGTLSVYANNLGIKNSVKFIGTVTDEELQILYTMARCFVYPSLYEGFGIPVLEAMSCLTPVVTSVSGSLMEVTKNAAVLCNPFDPGSISNSITQIVTDGDLYYKLSILGNEIAKYYSWDEIAQKTLSVYRSTVEEFQQEHGKKKRGSRSNKPEPAPAEKPVIPDSTIVPKNPPAEPPPHSAEAVSKESAEISDSKESETTTEKK